MNLVDINFADPHWGGFILPAYAATAFAFGALALVVFARLRRWAQAAGEDM